MRLIRKFQSSKDLKKMNCREVRAFREHVRQQTIRIEKDLDRRLSSSYHRLFTLVGRKAAESTGTKSAKVSRPPHDFG